MRVFVSYNHDQSEWVRDDLCVVLSAVGAEVLIDHERFKPGRALLGQMDALQDQAQVNVLVLSPAYLASDPCMHELRRAVARDPGFSSGSVVPVLREACTLPDAVRLPNPLYVDLRAGAPAAWRALLSACGAELGCDAAAWLEKRRELVDLLGRGESANLVVRGKPRWRPLIAAVGQALRDPTLGRQLGIVDLASGATATRRGLLEELLRACGSATVLPSAPDNADLVAFTVALRARATPALLALQHFDYAMLPGRGSDANLFSALRDLASVERKVHLLIHSERPFLELLPPGHPLSSLTQLRLVELIGS